MSTTITEIKDAAIETAAEFTGTSVPRVRAVFDAVAKPAAIAAAALFLGIWAKPLLVAGVVAGGYALWKGRKAYENSGESEARPGPDTAAKADFQL